MSANNKHPHQKTVKFNDFELNYITKRVMEEDITLSDVVREAIHFKISHDKKEYEKLKPVFDSMHDLQ